MGCRLWKYGLLTGKKILQHYTWRITVLLIVFLLEKNQLIVWNDRTVKK